MDATGDVECGVVQFDAHHFAVGEEFRESEGGSAGAAAEIEKALADESLARKVGEYLPLDGADDVCGVLMAGKTVAEPGKSAFLKEELDDFDGEGGFAGAEVNECSGVAGLEGDAETAVREGFEEDLAERVEKGVGHRADHSNCGGADGQGVESGGLAH